MSKKKRLRIRDEELKKLRLILDLREKELKEKELKEKDLIKNLKEKELKEKDLIKNFRDGLKELKSDTTVVEEIDGEIDTPTEVTEEKEIDKESKILYGEVIDLFDKTLSQMTLSENDEKKGFETEVIKIVEDNEMVDKEGMMKSWNKEMNKLVEKFFLERIIFPESGKEEEKKEGVKSNISDVTLNKLKEGNYIWISVTTIVTQIVYTSSKKENWVICFSICTGICMGIATLLFGLLVLFQQLLVLASDTRFKNLNICQVLSIFGCCCRREKDEMGVYEMKCLCCIPFSKDDCCYKNFYEKAINSDEY